MQVSHYFLGESVLVISVTHDKSVDATEVDEFASSQVKSLLEGNIMPPLPQASLRNTERKTTTDGRGFAAFTYDLVVEEALPTAPRSS